MENLMNIITIDIKILHSTTHTLHVEQTIIVSALRLQIINYYGISPERRHRFLFRGRVLEDDQRLSYYHVEEGHTLYLVEGSPISNLGPVIPFSIITLSNQLNHLGQMFDAYVNLLVDNANNEQAFRCARDNLIRRICQWTALLLTVRPMLNGVVAECLTNISMLLLDLSVRVLDQVSMAESGSLMCDLGWLLLMRTGYREVCIQSRYSWADIRSEAGDIIVVFHRN